MQKLALFLGVLTALGAHWRGQRRSVQLSAYADDKGWIDVQELTCAQLANTYQEDADYLTVWYSGWYNGLVNKHFMKPDRARDGSSTTSSCIARRIPRRRSVHGMDVVFKEWREQNGIGSEPRAAIGNRFGGARQWL